MNSSGEGSGTRLLAKNRKAFFNYHVLDHFEAGIVLSGAEMKSIRAGDFNLSDSYVASKGGELFVFNMYIKPYKFSRDEEEAATRPRKLLLHRREIDKLRGRSETKGLTIVPTALILSKRGFAKLEIALAKGKHAPDKRNALKEREGKRELQRALKDGRTE